MYCISVFGNTTSCVASAMKEAARQADIIELRLDMVRQIRLEKLLRSAARPVLVTCRSVSEGGKSPDDWGNISRRQKQAVELGADYVDLQWSMPETIREEILKNSGKTRVILSRHFQKQTPGKKELIEILNEMAVSGVKIIKIVTWAENIEDNFRILELIPEARKLEVQVIAFAMGPLGHLSRLLCVPMGGFLTFACLDAAGSTAPGQMTVQRMRRLTQELLYEY